jgi:hypothetical protein
LCAYVISAPITAASRIDPDANDGAVGVARYTASLSRAKQTVRYVPALADSR